jgi:hypothetical protein
MTELLVWALVLAGGAVLIAALAAPFEAMGWWAGWFGGEAAASGADRAPPAGRPGLDAHVLLLWGINDVGAATSEREQQFVDRLRQAVGPRVAIVQDVFPYSAFGMPLSGDRLLGRLWDRIVKVDADRMLKEGLLNIVVNIRNALQVGVSADRRYGPFYNYGAALQMADALRRAGHEPGGPVILLGYSGGGQVGLGAAAHVGAEVRAPVTVISLGGVLSSEPSLDRIEALVHLAGSRDLLQRIGLWIFPERWPVMRHSHWNRAKAAGRIRMVPLDGVGHAGDTGYFGDAAVGGATYLDRTVAVVSAEVAAAIGTHSDRVTHEGIAPPAR